MKAIILFPHQLFIKPVAGYHYVYIEDAHFFDRLPFHKHKLILHRASFKSHYDQNTCPKTYLDYPVSKNELDRLLHGFDSLYAYDPIEKSLLKAYEDDAITYFESPNFLTDTNEFKHFFKDKKRYVIYDFYVFQRKRTGIMMEDGKPLGGRFSFDVENRKKLPKNLQVPVIDTTQKSHHIDEAKKWVATRFPGNPGDVTTFNYPVDHETAEMLLNDFIFYKLVDFGPYQDALDQRDPYLFHSNLSAAINIGLLSPQDVMDRVLESDVPLPSKEGFIRQILGWREYVRALYVLEGKRLFASNDLNHTRKLSDAWGTSIGIPIVDYCIDKLNQTAYLHHIERLMVMGNLMMLLNIHPKEVYRYFSSYFIDAYDWVMIPNVFGMSQYAAEHVMTTKPYFSGSNYLKKMGVTLTRFDEVWDALFYLFIHDHHQLIQDNPRLSILTGLLNRKTAREMSHYRVLKEDLLKIATAGEFDE
jgi:deoxyribodipyrimidine photolyase-related protein